MADQMTKKIVLDRSTPRETAKAFILASYTKGVDRLLHFYLGSFFEWIGCYYVELELEAMRSRVYEFLDKASVKVKGAKPKRYRPFHPTKVDVDRVIDALKALCFLSRQETTEFWIEHVPDLSHDPKELIPFSNGLLHLPTLMLYNHTPVYFLTSILPYPYLPEAGFPNQFLAFSKELWPKDQESINTLQEILGLLLTSDTSFQKMFILIGPPRSGKGTLGRLLHALVGDKKFCSPTVSGLSKEFGLAPLIGKSVAMFSDARVDFKDQSVFAEKVLSISGEDAIDVNRKNLPAITVRLSTRILMLTNELPKVIDQSGALAKRFIVLKLEKSFFGKEDTKLTEKLIGEASQIINWSIAGLERLYHRGYFVQPTSATDYIEDLQLLSSPMKCFVQECCVIDGMIEVRFDILYSVYQEWCEAQGARLSSKPVFSKNLKAAYPHIQKVQHNDDDKVGVRYLQGIGLATVKACQEPASYNTP